MQKSIWFGAILLGRSAGRHRRTDKYRCCRGSFACDICVNNTHAKLLECVTLAGVREHQAAFQAIADANGGTACCGHTRLRCQRPIRRRQNDRRRLQRQA